MILPLLLAQATPTASRPAASPDRFQRCVALAKADPQAARMEAGRWRALGGGSLARECLGLAYAQERNWTAAASAFEVAARTAAGTRDDRAADDWAQAGNAWLAGGDPAKARTALDAALATHALTGLGLGEAQLDRARALVALDEPEQARADIDLALISATEDPLAWLLSATLARRGGDLPRARTDIAGALARAADDASVQLEAGNIAAASGDEPGARKAWVEAARLAPGRPAGRSATAALAQFGGSTDTRAARTVETGR